MFTAWAALLYRIFSDGPKGVLVEKIAGKFYEKQSMIQVLAVVSTFTTTDLTFNSFIFALWIINEFDIFFEKNIAFR